MKKILVMLFCSVSIFLIACNSLGTLKLKYPDNEGREVSVKSGGYYTSTKTWAMNGEAAKSSSYFVCVANYQIDMSEGAISIGAGVSKDDEVKVCFGLNGEENGDETTPPKVGSFEPAKGSITSPSYNSIQNASIRIFKDGKETKYFFDSAKTNGEIKITSSSGESISGEVNLSDSEYEIKGTFSAKAFKNK